MFRFVETFHYFFAFCLSVFWILLVKHHSIVYTKEAETADTYIERTAHKLSREHKVRVATSDGMEQVIIMGSGAFRMSAQELHEDVIRVEKEIREYIANMK